jgi:hypothetical protein
MSMCKSCSSKLKLMQPASRQLEQGWRELSEALQIISSAERKVASKVIRTSLATTSDCERRNNTIKATNCGGAT